ncbi:predicted protein [Botrytis cinerea T4]|uniref:Uncharacterized protein n=1 Tax=Botryotinia fuckeliana (strain T4) TaxID=999810 RepID=G2YU16_BOTF4|nr:predicted protein [Botrytis cinerea T4]
MIQPQHISDEYDISRGPKDQLIREECGGLFMDNFRVRSVFFLEPCPHVFHVTIRTKKSFSFLSRENLAYGIRLKSTGIFTSSASLDGYTKPSSGRKDSDFPSPSTFQQKNPHCPWLCTFVDHASNFPHPLTCLEANEANFY